MTFALWRSTHPRIAAQIMNLESYSPVSNHPSIGRDMSIVTGIDTDLLDTYEKIVTQLLLFTLSSASHRQQRRSVGCFCVH